MTPNPILDIVPSERGRLLDLARSLLGTQAEAEDAVQDAYLRAVDSAPAALASPQAWLSTVVRHIAIDRLRRRRLEALWMEAERPGADTRTAPSAEDDASRRMERDHALRFLADTLSPAEAAIVLLRDVFDIDHEVIAAKAGKTEAACRQMVHRALLRLKAQVARGERPKPELPEDAPDDGETADAVFVLCVRAIEGLSPNPLFAILAAPVVSAAVRAAEAADRREPPSGDASRAMPSTSRQARTSRLTAGFPL